MPASLPQNASPMGDDERPGRHSLDALDGPRTASIVIACEMIDDEVLAARARSSLLTGISHPLVWMPAGLHERPETMKAHLQEVIDLVDHANRAGNGATLPSIRPGSGPAEPRMTELTVSTPIEDVILALGYCGNGIMGLVSQTARLVFPRVDDCISLFLNDGCTREQIERDSHAFYLTRGWLSHDNPFIDSYRRWIERYGPEKAERFRQVVMAGYERITLLDTGAYDVEETRPDSERLAAELLLDHKTAPGSFSLLERLFAGPWDGEIVRAQPGTPVSIWHLLSRE